MEKGNVRRKENRERPSSPFLAFVSSGEPGGEGVKGERYRNKTNQREARGDFSIVLSPCPTVTLFSLPPTQGKKSFRAIISLNSRR